MNLVDFMGGLIRTAGRKALRKPLNSMVTPVDADVIFKDEPREKIGQRLPIRAPT